MKRTLLATGFVAVAILGATAAQGRTGKTLDIYFIDVEGGQSTLLVTPAGQSLLVDTGYAGFNGRDSGRIVTVAHEAGVTQLDYLLMTHFHRDHAGGVVDVARQIPIRTFLDHGDLERTSAARTEEQFPGTLAVYNAYVAVRAKGRHLEPKPGDRLPLKGLDVTFVSAAAATIVRPLPGAGQANATCGGDAPPPDDALENPRSTGFYLRYGAFRFLDIGDLSGSPLFALVCPNNLIGLVDLYLVPHHGGADASYPATLWALRPRVAIVNNGAIKGGSPEVFANLRRAPGLEDAWQLHTSKNDGADNFADSQVANLDETTGHWIKVSAQEGGAFTVTNGRTGVTKAFAARPKS